MSDCNENSSERSGASNGSVQDWDVFGGMSREEMLDFYASTHSSNNGSGEVALLNDPYEGATSGQNGRREQAVRTGPNTERVGNREITFNPDGSPISARYDNGLTVNYRWSPNGTLTAIEQSDGQSWQFRDGKWHIYDRPGHEIGQSPTLEVSVGDRTFPIQGTITRAELSRLIAQDAAGNTRMADVAAPQRVPGGDGQQQNAGAQTGDGPAPETDAAGEEADEVVRLSTNASHLLERNANKEIVRVRFPNGDPVDIHRDGKGIIDEVRFPDGSSWKLKSRSTDPNQPDVWLTSKGEEIKGKLTLDNENGTLKLHGPDVSITQNTDGRQIRTNSTGSSITAENGNVTEVKYPDGSTRKFEYDPNIGALKTVTNPDGTQLTRDNLLSDQWRDPNNPNDKGRDFFMTVMPNGDFHWQFSDGINHKVDRNGAITETQPKPNANHLPEIFNSVLPHLDLDRSNVLDKDELERGYTNPEMSGARGQALHALYKNYDKLSTLDGEAGISFNDVRLLDQYNTQSEAIFEVANSTEGAVKAFGSLDSNSDGQLTVAELDEFLAKPQNGRVFTQISALRDFMTINGMPSITREQINDIRDRSLSDSNRQLTRDLNEIFKNSYDGLQGMDRNLYGARAGGDVRRAIRPEAVDQGEVGNCYFMAGLSTMAERDPEALAGMVKRNDDGTYTVTFRGAPDKPQTVKPPTDAELSRFAKATEYGAWPAIFEKAYGQYRQQKHEAERWFWESSMEGQPPQMATDGGSATWEGMKILTGKEVDQNRFFAKMNDPVQRAAIEQELHNRLSSAGKNLVHAGIILADPRKDHAGLPNSHEYSVLSYDPTTRTMTIKNPQGKNEPNYNSDGKDDGIFRMSLQDFMKYFSEIAFTRD